MRFGRAVILLMAWLAASCGRAQDEQPYSCPQEQFIDCMPIVSPDRVDKCSGPYHEFIKTHCPEVQFAY